MVQPMLPKCGKLSAEPPQHHVHRDAPLDQKAGSGNLLGRDSRVPRPGQQRRGHPQQGRRRQPGMAESDLFVLIVSPVSGRKADLAQRMVESGLFSQLRQLYEAIDVAAGALFEITSPPRTLAPDRRI